MIKKLLTGALLLFIFVGLLWLERPLRGWLIHQVEPELHAKLLAGIIVRWGMLVGFFALIFKAGFSIFNGFRRPVPMKNLHALLLPLVVIIGGFMSNLDLYRESTEIAVFLFSISVLGVAILEEAIFRGLVFPLYIQAFRWTKHPILTGAISSALLFGMIHFVNLFQQPDNVEGIISQVLFALSIGVFFAGLLVRTESLIWPILIHALINFTFGASELSLDSPPVSSTLPEAGIDWSSVIPTTLFFLFILGGGIYMILRSDQQKLLSYLNIGSKTKADPHS